MSLNVLSLTNEFEDEIFGGAGTAVTGMLHTLALQDIRQTVIVPRSGWDVPSWIIKGENFAVLGLPRNDRYFGYLGLVNTELVRLEFPDLWREWDLIHVHSINFAPLAYAISEGRIPLLYSVYSFLREELDGHDEPELLAQFVIQDELLARCHCIHLISRSEWRYLAVRAPELLPKVEVAPLGCCPPEALWLGGKINALLYVGRLIDYKGIEDLLKALVWVRKRGKAFTLDIVGTGPNYYIQHLHALVQSLNLNPPVKFHGWESPGKVKEWMQKSGVLIVPSHRESYGLVALEGMAAGIPLIISNAGGLAELGNSECALVFEKGNIRQLVQAIENALNNPSLMQLLAQNARRRAENLVWTKFLPRYWQLYTDTIYKS